MDFLTTDAPPVPVTIDGTAYHVPRFLMPALKAWAEELVQKQADFATEGMKADDKARFLYYWPKPVIDVGTLIQYTRTPEGAEYVVNAQLKLAGVSDDVRAKLLKFAPPDKIRDLSERLSQSQQAAAQLDMPPNEPGHGLAAGGQPDADPLPEAPESSGESPATGAQMTPASASPTPA